MRALKEGAMGHRSLIVRRRDIETFPRPVGGRFAEVRMVPFSVPVPFSSPLGIYCVNTPQRIVALTYDDGPHPEHTPAILDELARHSARATFFMLTREARKHPGVVRRVVADGHEVALHGEDHASLLTMSARTASATIRAAKTELETIAETRVRLYRPPYGHHTNAQAVALAAAGLSLVVWSGDAFDWVDDTPEAVAGRAAANLFPGCILLLHDNRGDPETLLEGQSLPTFDRAAVTRLLLEHMAREGYVSPTLSAALSEFQPVRSMARERMRQA